MQASDRDNDLRSEPEACLTAYVSRRVQTTENSEVNHDSHETDMQRSELLTTATADLPDFTVEY